MDGLRKAVRGLRNPGGSTGSDYAADELARLGLVDREYYQAQCGVTFPDDVAAARHAIRTGAKHGWSFHPLVEPDHLPTAWIKPWKEKGDFTPVLRGLVGAALKDPSPLFHPAGWLARHPAAAEHAGGPLGHFLAAADADTVMPTPPAFGGRPPTWGAVRAEAMRRAVEYGEQRARGGGRTSDSWNARDHLAWLKRWASAPVPTFPDRPAVSIVMPVKNRPVAVVEAIRSIQAQTHRDWELLVVDDGSTDNTVAVLTDLAAHDPRIIVLELPVSGGAAAARNVAIKEARGVYLAFLDSDNTWEPVFLRLGLAAMHGQGIRAAHAVAEVTAGGPAKYLAFEGTHADLMMKNHVPMIVLIAETELVREAGGLDPEFRRWMDHDLALRLAARTDIKLLPFIGARYDSVVGTSDRITRTESDNWEFAALGKNLVDWTALSAGLADRVPGRTSILMPTFRDFGMTRRAVEAVLAEAGDDDVEIIVVDNGSQRSVSARLWATFAGEPRVVVRRLPRNYNFAGGSNAAFAMSTGDRVVFLNNDTVVRTGWLRALLAPLDRPEVLGTQPLLVFDNDLVQSAGTVFLADNRVASAFLPGHPVEDARRDSGGGFDAVTAAALAMRAEDVVALRGFDCLYANGMEDVDLCLRARERHPDGFFEVVHDSVVTHHESQTPGRGTHITENRRIFLDRWRGRLPSGAVGRARYRSLGFEIVALAGDENPYPAPRPVLRRPGSVLGDVQVAEAPRPMRWSINIGSIAGPLGDLWGDTHFAAAFAEALQELGQEPVVFRHEAFNGPTAHLSDVVLSLRGLSASTPQPGAVNVLWVISHPELVDVREVQQYDVVAAASRKWAEEMGRRAGRHIHVVHQATNDRLFAPTALHDDGDDVLFVGGTRGQTTRKIVSDALEVGANLAVYGPDWNRCLPEGVLRADYLANEDLSRAYGAAGIVLNDHWADMARNGFMNNRLFDAAASGARVVSDYVDGIDEFFHGLVRTYSSLDELAFLTGETGRASFPPVEERRRLAERVRREHSFRNRAEQLLDAVHDELRARAKRDATD